VESDEELTLSYVSHEKSFAERETIFRNWIEPHVGFSCQCDWCHLIRNSEELRKLEGRIHRAYKDAAALVTKDSVKMAVAVERVMSSNERAACRDVFAKLSPSLQHNAGADLLVMEGVCCAQNGNFPMALQYYQEAAKIKYAVRGGYRLDHAKDLWRIVGASMACGNSAEALRLLSAIYQNVFLPTYMDNISRAFRELTLNYTLPWWEDAYDRTRQHAVEELIDRAIKDHLGTTAKSKKKKAAARKK